MAIMKVEIVSREMIKPTSPTPEHLKDFKICLLDELAPPSYVPIVLFYSSSDFGFDDDINDHHKVTSSSTLISNKLKESLSKMLTRFYPFAGELRGNIAIECSDKGALYVEAKADIAAAEVAKNPETHLLYQLLPFDPYRAKPEEVVVVAGVQATFFECGSVGIGVCLWHKVADGATVVSFLNAWAATANRSNETMAPRVDAASFFPPRGIDLIKQSDMIRSEVVVTKRFEFGGKNLADLKNKITEGNTSSSPTPTRVEAVTALIWKAAMEAFQASSGKDTLPSSILTHLVNIRGRMDPPLPDTSIGNLWRLTLAPYMEANHKEEGTNLHQLVGVLKKAIARVDRGYVSELRGENGMAKAIEPLREMRELAMGGGAGGVEVYTFSSWTRFPLYEVDFGWGQPVRVCTITVPVRNCVILMGTKSGDGIEAWVTLTEADMEGFRCNQELLQFVATSNV